MLQQLLGIVAVLAVTGCASAPSAEQLMAQVRDDDASTAERIRALDQLGNGTANHLGIELMRLLDHPDGGLRYYACAQLESILGRPIPFRPYGPIEQRRTAIHQVRVIWRNSLAIRGVR